MTAQEIIERAEMRFNAKQNRFGLLTREDIIDFFKTLPDGANRKAELTNFIDQLPFVTQAEKERIYSDLESYA
jgi:hypothetical protein